MSGDERVPPETMICRRALNVRDCCCIWELVSVKFRYGNFLTYAWVKRLCWHGSDSNCLAILDDDFINLGIALEVKVLVNGAGRVDICVCRVTAAASL
jgi:hypothetical protein